MSPIKGVNHTTVLVLDKEKAINFYCNILGLEKLEIGKSVWARAGKQFIHISKTDKAVPKSFIHFAIEVSNFNDYIRNLIAQKIDVFDLDNNLNKIALNSELDNKSRQFFVEDPSGNYVEIIDVNNSFFHPE